jgi:tetratricopeptide (TPR) repeat protein
MANALAQPWKVYLRFEEIKMKSVSKFALALMASIVVLPSASIAKDSKKVEKAPAKKSMKFSPGFIKAYSPALDAMNKKKDLAGAAAMWPQVKAAIVNDDDKNEAGIFGYNVGKQTGNSAMTIEGIDLVISSATTDPALKPVFLFEKGATAFNSKDYNNAATWFQDSYNGGFRKSEIERLIATSLDKLGKSAEAMGWMRKFLTAQATAGTPADAGMYGSTANMALKIKDFNSANAILRDMLKYHRNTDAWYDAINVFNRTTDMEYLEQLDMFRLMRITNSLRYEQDYNAFVDVIDKRRYPTETVRIIKEGQLAKIISSNNRKILENLTDAIALSAQDANNAALSEVDAKKSGNPYDALLTGDAYFSQANYAKAIELYRAALAKGAIKDREGKDQIARAQMHLGMALVMIKDWENAKTELAKVPAGKRRDISEYWLLYAGQQMAPAIAAAPAVKS